MRTQILILFLFLNSALSIDPLVLTTQGLIRGLNSENGTYSMFLGVPYATLDANNLFGDSIPHHAFTDTFEANDDSALCPQFVGDGVVGTIDCLRLNVYVPNNPESKNKLPVMVLIHGGAFIQGSKKQSEFGPQFLVDHDVIMVSINYRLGPYGFLCLSSHEFNNQGIKDQILALRWVKNNIEAFGGDVNRITVFGQSAGAMSIDLLLLNANEGLFSKAIVQSGPALSPWVVSVENDSFPLRLAEYFEFKTGNVTTAMNFLSHVDPEEVMKATMDLGLFISNGHPVTKPCVEKNIGDILQDYPANISPKVKGLDIMIGHVNNEIMFMYPNSNEEFYLNYEFRDELEKAFEEVRNESLFRDFYIGDNVEIKDVQRGVMNFGSDFAFNYPTDRTVKRYIDSGANKVYRYMFTYEGDRNVLKLAMNLTSDGAGHSDELGYLFGMEELPQRPNEQDQVMIKRLTEMWTNFAKYGDPTPTTSDLIPVKWEPTTLEAPHYMKLDNPLVLGKRPLSDRMAFWDLYYKLNGDVVKGHK